MVHTFNGRYQHKTPGIKLACQVYRRPRAYRSTAYNYVFFLIFVDVDQKVVHGLRILDNLLASLPFGAFGRFERINAVARVLHAYDIELEFLVDSDEERPGVSNVLTVGVEMYHDLVGPAFEVEARYKVIELCLFVKFLKLLEVFDVLLEFAFLFLHLGQLWILPSALHGLWLYLARKSEVLVDLLLLELAHVEQVVKLLQDSHL